MEKTLKLLDLDCACCAEKIEKTVRKIPGVLNVSINFLSQKMVLEAEEEKFDSVLAEAKKIIKKIEPDVTIKD